MKQNPSHLPIDEFEEGGFPSAVWPHESNSRLEVDPEVDVLVDVRGVREVAETDVLDHDHWGRNGAGVGEDERDDL